MWPSPLGKTSILKKDQGVKYQAITSKVFDLREEE
jgi:hypothetical protein